MNIMRPSLTPIYRDAALVDDHYCLLRLALTHSRHECCVRLSRPNARILDQAEFVLYLLRDNRWLIIPKQHLPKSKTMFSLFHSYNGVVNRHDWIEYLEAWRLLKRRDSLAGPSEDLKQNLTHEATNRTRGAGI